MSDPAVVVAAFVPVTEQVGGVAIHPFTLAHWLALEAIQSPIVKGRAPESFGEILNAVALVSVSGSAALKMAADKGAFAARVETLACELRPADVPALAEALARQVERAFSTALKPQPPEGECKTA